MCNNWCLSLLSDYYIFDMEKPYLKILWWKRQKFDNWKWFQDYNRPYHNTLNPWLLVIVGSKV